MRKGILLLFLIAFGLLSAYPISTNIQNKSFSQEFFINGNLDCQGYTICILDVTDSANCTLLITGNNPQCCEDCCNGSTNIVYNATYSGILPFSIMGVVPANGQYRANLSCISGNMTFIYEKDFQVHELDLWNEALYSIFLIAPMGLILWAFYRILLGNPYVQMAMGAVGILIFKYLYIYMTNYTLFAEFWGYDAIVVLLGVALFLFGMIEELKKSGKTKEQRVYR